MLTIDGYDDSSLHAAVLGMTCAIAIGCAGRWFGTDACRRVAADATGVSRHASNATLLKLGIAQGQAGWTRQDFITDDTEGHRRARESGIRRRHGASSRRGGPSSTRSTVPADQRRQLTLLQRWRSCWRRRADRRNPKSSRRSWRGSSPHTAKGKWCADASSRTTCKNIDDIARILAESRNETSSAPAWEGWHTISPPMRRTTRASSSCSNKGAKELGFADTGAMWRAKYDMPPDEFTKELDRLWDQVRPLYLKLHAYVRMKLRAKCGDAVPAAARCRRTCSATSGRRTGRTSTRWSRRPTPIRASR